MFDKQYKTQIKIIHQHIYPPRRFEIYHFPDLRRVPRERSLKLWIFNLHHRKVHRWLHRISYKKNLKSKNLIKKSRFLSILAIFFSFLALFFTLRWQLRHQNQRYEYSIIAYVLLHDALVSMIARKNTTFLSGAPWNTLAWPDIRDFC